MSDEVKLEEQTSSSCEDKEKFNYHGRASGSSGGSSRSTQSSQSHEANRIKVKAARSRNFIFGAIGHEDSFLGETELSKALPSGKVSVFIVTWNMGGRDGPQNYNDILLPKNLEFLPEIYAIGAQETPGYGGSNADHRDLSVNLQSTLGPSHVLLSTVSLGVLSLFIFIRRELIWYVSLPEECVYNSRPKATNMVKTKGAVAVSFSLFGTTLLFINCHLPAHAKRNQERLDEYKRICRSIDLPRNLRPLKPSYQSNNVTSRFDCVFWFGDLNFRIEQKYTDALKMLTRASLTSFEVLLHDDQLRKALNKGDIFYGFKEAKSIDFAPTYKYRIGSDGFDLLSERVPSYTDRILFRSKRKNSVSCLLYDCVQSIKTSDHKPVFALMEITVRSGRDDIPLNAGAFRRDVYLEGLRRRANEHPTIEQSSFEEDDNQSKEKRKQTDNSVPSAICRVI